MLPPRDNEKGASREKRGYKAQYPPFHVQQRAEKVKERERERGIHYKVSPAVPILPQAL